MVAKSVIVISGGTPTDVRQIEKAVEWEVKVIRGKKRNKNVAGQIAVKIFS